VCVTGVPASKASWGRTAPDLNRLREELGVGTEARSADPDSPYAAYDGEDVDEDALDDDGGDEDDDEDDWSSSRLARQNARAQRQDT